MHFKATEPARQPTFATEKTTGNGKVEQQGETGGAKPL